MTPLHRRRSLPATPATPGRHARRGPRLTAAVLAAGLVGAVLGLGTQPATAAASGAHTPRSLGAPRAAAAKAGPHGKFSAHDRTLLQAAQSRKAPAVTVLLATAPDRTARVPAEVAKLGGHAEKVYDHLGYVRASVPTGKAEQLAALADVTALDLDETYRMPDPSPVTAQDARTGRPGPAPAPAPGPRTPAANPYLPTADTGAVDFVKQHPAWDGRGVTVGILDTGVDLDHPALRTTTTGERKVAAWVTATDPVLDGDPTWLEMRTKVTVTGATFTSGGATWTAPAGSYEFQTFAEKNLYRSELGGDVNRDGDYTDVFGVLYRPADHTVWVDANQDHVFGDGDIVRPYAESGQVAHFGTDDPRTAVAETVPFTVEYRDGVDLSARGGPYAGKTADFVSLGLVSGTHGTHVAGITAGHGLFGGAMEGAAPGARIVSERVCVAAGCSDYALTEGMIDAVVNQHVDVVNMSIGGLTALNDGSSVRELLYDRLIDDYGVQLFVSSGNDGPGMNTVAEPSTATEVVSVGASVSKQTWWADYGSEVDAAQALFPFSSRGPREDGDLKPTLVAPGAAVSTVPLWQAGEGVPQAGYDLPPGYAMYNGTSMASPEATGAAALLLSAAGAKHRQVTPAALRTALTSGAAFLPGEPAYAQGAGLISVGRAWQVLARNAQPAAYTVRAPVCSVLSGALATPGSGAGLYNRCAPDQGGQQAGHARTYQLQLTRTDGGSGATALSWLGDDGTFSAPSLVHLARGSATPVAVRALPRSTGAHSAVLRVDDLGTPGVDKLVLVTVVAADGPAAPSFGAERRGVVARNGTDSLFVAVPAGAQAVAVGLSGLAEGSQTRFLAVDPQGKPVEDTAAARCYANYSDPADCDPAARTYHQPMAGVWEFQVDSRRTSPQQANPYQLTAAVQGAAFDPASGTVDEAAVHEPVERGFTVTNTFGPVEAHAVGGALGAMAQERPTVADGQMTGKQITVPRDGKRLEIAMGNAADPHADLDLYLVSSTGVLVGSSTHGGAEESITVDGPAPGYYQVYIAGTHVPSGSTAVDVQDTVFSDSLGQVTVDDARPVTLAHGGTLAVRGRLTADALPAEGRRLVGRFSVATDRGDVIGSTDLVVERLTQPKATVTASFGPVVAFGLSDTGQVAGSQQVAGKSVPIRWDAATGVTQLANGGGTSGYVLGQSRTAGYAAGQLTIGGRTHGGVWNAAGDLTVLPIPDWKAYTFDRAFAVNDSGTVVGNATGYVTDPATGRNTEVNDAFVWTAAGGFRALPHLTANASLTEPLAIADDGTVVGHSALNGKRRAVKWAPDGTVTDLGTLPGMADSYAQAVNASGEIVGTSGDDAFVLRPGGTMTRLPDFGFDAHALGVNDAGWIVGTAETAPDDTTAVVWDPQGRMFDLGAMVDGRRWAATEGIGVNNAGQVAFYALDKADGGSSRVVLATL
ncbi:S8 family serine peptidase [Streptomyces sp. NRRL F-5123]|uniref:S8 family serine peptidase n=1 Tax=Streptomyces sp. NRRL F-5123 TaxID=1463856 RepID=UPI0007C54A74|nr:S8 family serine peptidase [Streptomyces sp. NRRL F-5123]